MALCMKSLWRGHYEKGMWNLVLKSKYVKEDYVFNCLGSRCFQQMVLQSFGVVLQKKSLGEKVDLLGDWKW